MPFTSEAYRLKELAQFLATRDRTRPSQVNLKRAVSTAYYALFRLILDEGLKLIFKGNPADNAVFYQATRSVRHARLKEVAEQMTKPALSNKLRGLLQNNTVSSDMQFFCRAVIELQERRHDADYNTQYRAERQRTVQLLEACESAFTSFRALIKNKANNELNVFIMLLLNDKEPLR